MTMSLVPNRNVDHLIETNDYRKCFLIVIFPIQWSYGLAFGFIPSFANWYLAWRFNVSAL